MSKRKRLSTRIAIITAIILVLIFTTFITTVGLVVNHGMKESIESRIFAASQDNAHQIEAIVRDVSLVSRNMSEYMQKAYEMKQQGYINMTGEKGADSDSEDASEQSGQPADEEADEPDESAPPDESASQTPAAQTPEPEPAEARMYTSLVYGGQEIEEISSDFERYIVESSRAAVRNNDNIAGVGVMMEPYAFDQNLPEYAYYINMQNVDDELSPSADYAQYSAEVYYSQPKQTKAMMITEPYEWDGMLMATVAVPILQNGNFMGSIATDINISNFESLNFKSDEYPSMFGNILTENCLIVYDSQTLEDVGKPLSEFWTDADLQILKSKMASKQRFTMTNTASTGQEVTRFFTPIAAGDITWWNELVIETGDLNRSVAQTVGMMMIFAVVALVILVAVLVATISRSLRPIRSLVADAEKISQGDFNISPPSERRDEIGELTHAFSHTAKTLQTIIGDIGALLGSMSHGDFTVDTEYESEYVGGFNPIIKSIRQLNVQLSGTLEHISGASAQVSGGATQIASNTQALSRGSQEQLSAIEQLSLVIKNTSESIQNNAHNAGQAEKLSREAGAGVANVNEHMQRMLTAMSNISGAASEIGKVIKAIDDIAFQTNILALNAAVEAARAGAAGKGFAVVADEVRNLAQKSAASAQSSSALIQSAIDAVSEGTAIANSTGEQLQSVVEKSKAVVERVDEIARICEQQANDVSQLTDGVTQISTVVHTNTMTARNSADASGELSQQAQMLKELVGKFKLHEGAGHIAAPDSQARGMLHS